MNRRSFFKWLFASIAAIWALAFTGLVTRFLKPPESLPSLEANTIKAGRLEELIVGTARFFPHARQPVWVMRLPSNEVVAVSAICTHFHCILKWQDSAKIYECPCHRGSFDQYGNVLAGPPPAPLPKLRVELRRGEVYVHLS